MVTGDSQEEVMIFRDRQTHMHHNIYITIITNIIITIVFTDKMEPYARQSEQWGKTPGGLRARHT